MTEQPLMSDIIIDHYTGTEGVKMTYPGEDEYLTELARTNWQQGQREELARHTDRTFKCRECGYIWAQVVLPGDIPTCPDCEEAEHE